MFVGQTADTGNHYGQHQPGGQQNSARMRCRQLQPQLHEHRQQVSGAEQRRTVNNRHDAAHGELAVAKQSQVHQRFTPGARQVALPKHKRHQRRDGNAQQHPRHSSDPAVQLNQAVQQTQRADAGNRQSAPVQAGTDFAGCPAAWGSHGYKTHGHVDGGQTKWHHHEKDRTPAKPVDQQPAHAGANGRRQHHTRAVKAAGAALLGGLKSPHDDDGWNRLNHACRQPLSHPRQQHQAEIVGQTAQQASCKQQQHGADVGAAVTKTSQQPGR